MPEQKKQSVSQALLEEVQEIRDMLQVIEKRSKYLKPPSLQKNALRGLVTGILQGVGVFIGGTIIVGIIVFTLGRLVRSGAIQDYFGNQIEKAVENTISERLPTNPFSRPTSE